MRIKRRQVPSVTITELSDLNQDSRNARKHTKRNIELIQTSIEELGTGRSLLIDEDNTIIAGNATQKAAKKAGITKVMIVEPDPDTLVAVRRTNLTAKQKRRLGLIDNRATDLSVFDVETLREMVDEDATVTRGIWTSDEIDKLLNDTPDMPSTRQNTEPVISYVLVFDDIEQQSRFHNLLRELKRNYRNLDTAAARLDAFIQENIG